MNWFLFVTLIVITYLNYRLSNKTVLFPSVIASAMFSFSAFLLALNKEWNYQINIETYFFIVIALLLFSIGALVGKTKLVIIKGPRIIDRVKSNILGYEYVSTGPLVVLSIVCLCVTCMYATHQYNVSLSLGNTSGIFGMLAAIRAVAQTKAEVFQLSTILNIGISFVRAIGYLCVYLIVSDVFHKRKIRWMYTIPIICLILNVILSSGRGALIALVSAILFDIYIIRKQSGKKIFSREMIKYGIMGVVLFFVAFRVLGNMTGNSAVLSVWESLSIYAGSSILCLDTFLQSDWNISAYIGQYTFKGIYNILGMLGVAVPHVSNHFEMVRWSHYSSNVYTSFHPYLQDFGIIGALIVQLLIGLLFGFVWARYNSTNASKFLVITFGRYWGNALAYFSIAERLCTTNLAINTFVEIFISIVLIEIFLKEGRLNGQMRDES